MKTLRKAIQEAEIKKVAIGHFNISNLEALWAIWNVARRLDVPVIIGLSEGERKFFGMKEAVLLVRHFREEYDYPIYINADHTYSIDGVKEAIDAGVDSVIFDGAKLSFADNVKLTKEAVAYARKKWRDIVVEGELGYIGMSSQVLKKIPEGVSLQNLTTASEAKQYVKETGVDLLAPAVGNIHGMLKNAPEPRLNIARVKEIRSAAGVPLVLHGGSGTNDQDFRDAIASGMAIVHINTEIRVAYRRGIEAALKQNKEEVAPYKILGGALSQMEQVIESRLRLFNNLQS